MEYGIHDPLLLRVGTPARQIRGNRLVDLNESRFLIDDVELMLVSQFMVTSAQFPNGLVVLVQDGGVSVTMPVASIMVALEGEENILAPPARLLEVSSPDGVVAVTRPDQFPVIAEDLRGSLAGAMHFPGFIREAREGGHEEISLVDIGGGGDSDVQLGRRQIRTRLKLPVCSHQRQQSSGRCEPERAHDAC